MVGIYNSHNPIPGPTYPCPACHGQMGTALRHRTAHFCGIPLLPLGTKHESVCYSCGYRIPLSSGRHRFFPGSRNPLGLSMGHRSRGRSNDWDMRNSYTAYFSPPGSRMRRYRY